MSGKLFETPPDLIHLGRMNYPTLRIAVLNGLFELKQAFDLDAGLFESDTCPYDIDTREILKKILKTQVVIEKVVDGGGGSEARGKGRPTVALTAENLEDLVEDIKKDLADLRKVDGAEADDETKLKILGARAKLTEQLFKLREKGLSISHQARFQQTVIGILDELIDEDGREAFLARIEPYKE
jgi:hypothetical protein